jgi:3-hydroxybutyryl-CoA dehydrogenase
VIEAVTVLGAGRMAGGIARACAAAGARVTIAARDAERAAVLAGGLGPSFRGTGIAPAAFAGADLVLETIVEDHDAKADLLTRIEPWLDDHALVATNTSGLSVTALARALAEPGRFAGLHFLHPAQRTSLVEVVAGDATAHATMEELVALVRRMGKRPLVLRREVPGCIWNRIQFAVLRECLHLLDAGVCTAAEIDLAVSDGLAPRWATIGPLGTADLGGLGTFAAIAEGLFGALADGDDAGSLRARADAGESFYTWTEEAEAAVRASRDETIALLNARASGRPRPEAGPPSPGS